MATSDLKPSSPEYERWVDPATGEFRVLEPGQTFKSVTDKITRIVLTPHTPLGWFALFGVFGAIAVVLLVAVTWLFLKGVGIWAITMPVATLVNRETSGAAEAFAAVLRQAGTSLILGGKTAGQAMIAQEYPLKNGQRLRIASGPVRLGDGSVLSSTGLKPDISVEVSPMAEQSYFADAFRELLKTNSLLAANAQAATNSPAGTNRARRPRFNEAELVRERKLGAVLDNDLENLSAEPEKPIVQDPVLARALDLLKGLNLVRQSRS